MKHQDIVEKMTLFEKASLMSGKNVWQTQDYKHLGIPSLFLSDGPHGIRKQLGSADHLGLNKSIEATCFPTAATIANSWDEELANRIGQALGKEARELGVNVILGPGLNIKRNPLCGRNFEYFSEDPYLTARMSVGYIKGIQSQGVAATPKHYAVNSQELRRMSNDSIIDERTLREIYLPGFEASVKEAKTDFIMTAYNRINSQYANEHQHLLENILYDEWNYEGAVVTDWGGSNDHVLGVERGSHLEMPGTGVAGALEITQAVEEGRLSETVLDQRVDELLSVVLKLAHDETASDDLTEKTIFQHHQLAYEAALNSAVLLKNKDKILPISTEKKIALIGDFAFEPRYQGSGSSLVNPTQLESIESVVKDLSNPNVQLFKGYTRENVINQTLIDEAIEGAKAADVVIIFAGLPEISESEGMDRSDMNFPSNQQHLIESISSINKNVVVVLSGGSPMTLPWEGKVSAILHTYLAGQASGQATWDLLTGKHSPSGKLNETYPLSYQDVPSKNYYPGLEATSEYKESIFVGYRYYDTANIPVQFPFGFGLSYSSFVYSNLTISEHAVTFALTNVGSIPAAETAQVYLSKEQSAIFRSSKELVAFQKVFLEPGETKQLTIEIPERAFEFFNPSANKWEIEAGNYTLAIGESSQKLHLFATVEKEGIDASGIYTQEVLEQYRGANIQNVSDDIYEILIARALPDKKWNTAQPLGVNDTLSQMYYAKGWVARKAYQLITYLLNRSMAKGKPNLNLYFNYNMTFRAMAKMTGGLINQRMVNEIVRMVNGNFWSGSKGMISAFFENRRLTKRSK
ncbi:beta-glucosidase family protein [Fundicoccus sp. Sow4_F4]|uniref:beta-glucosidase n=1 Tax=Fundicoccus sp. Sow4_F4 TaxID=3438783 RepID=UPI003F919483